jgi:hypothetical protein
MKGFFTSRQLHLHYYPSVSPQAATILYYRKLGVEAMSYIRFIARCDDFLWGRLLTCGRLVIGPPLASRKIPSWWFSSLRLETIWGSGRLADPPRLKAPSFIRAETDAG